MDRAINIVERALELFGVPIYVRHEVVHNKFVVDPYSCFADGRAVLRSSIREYLCSEAMHGLGIPTTRALALCGSDDPVYREAVETAAVLTRIAPSFLRFGHFEYFYYTGREAEIQQLADYLIRHYYPDCRDADNPFDD